MQSFAETVLPGNEHLADHQPQRDRPGQSKITNVTEDIGRRLQKQTSGGQQRQQLEVMSFLRFVVCCARETSCIHEPWPKGSVRLFGWRRKRPMPCRIVYMRISQVGRKISPRLRSEDTLGTLRQQQFNSRQLSYRGRGAKRRPRACDVSPTDLLQPRKPMRQDLGALRGRCGTRYKANTQFSQRTDVDPKLAWSGVSLITDPRWGVLTDITFCATFGFSANRHFVIPSSLHAPGEYCRLTVVSEA